MKHDPKLPEALVRQRLFPMVLLAFATLHPGQPPLRRAWYLKAMCWWLERVARRELLRSMIWLQPRALKSITVAIVYPCWLLGRDPTLEIMVATYGETLSREHAEKRRQIIESDWYKRIFSNTRLAERGNRLLDLKTTAGGGVKAVSVGGPVTGRGADIIILDDCMKSDEHSSEAAREEVKHWFSSALTTRLNNKERGAIVSIQQRIHEDDLPAHLQLLPHPLDPYARVRHTRPEGGGDLRTGELAGHLEPPQRERRAFAFAHPLSRVPDLPALPGQLHPEHRRAFHLGAGVRAARRRLQRHRAAGREVLPRQVAADLAHRDGRQPRPEAARRPQGRQLPQGTHHDVLHDVVDGRVVGHRLADQVVDHRQVAMSQLVDRRPVTAPCGGGQSLIGKRGRLSQRGVLTGGAK